MPPLSDTIGGLRFAAIDFESAGAARGETDQPVKIGIAACSRLEDEPDRKSTRLNSSHIL